MGFGINAAGARDTIAERKLLMVGIKPKDGQDKMWDIIHIMYLGDLKKK